MKRLCLMLLFGSLLAAISLPVFASEGDIIVGGEVVMRVRASAGGLSILERVMSGSTSFSAVMSSTQIVLYHGDARRFFNHIIGLIANR